MGRDSWNKHLKEDQRTFLALFLFSAFGVCVAFAQNILYQSVVMGGLTIAYLIIGYVVFWKNKLNCPFCFALYCCTLLLLLIATAAFFLNFYNRTSMSSTRMLAISRPY
jgi:hypothetical protein